MRPPPRRRPPDQEALERFVDDVHARSAAQAETDDYLRRHHPTAATALERARAAEDAERRRRLAEAETNARRHHRPPRPEPSSGPASYAEITATVDRNERQRLAAWEAAMARQHHRNGEHLARAERLVATEHQLRHQQPIHHVIRFQRNPAATAWIWFRVLLVLGVLYVLLLGCLISVAANHLDNQPTPTTSTAPSPSPGVMP